MIRAAAEMAERDKPEADQGKATEVSQTLCIFNNIWYFTISILQNYFSF